jgi:hypothetical protein
MSMPPKKKQTISGAKGQKPVTFQKGGLHESLDVPAGKPIPKAKVAKAAAGDYGPKAQKQAVMAKGMLAAGQKTAAKNKRKAK